MDKEKKLEQLRNALGMTAEMALIFYRSAIGAGATPEEAMKLIQAYIGAVLFNQNKKKPDGEEGQE